MTWAYRRWKGGHCAEERFVPSKGLAPLQSHKNVELAAQHAARQHFTSLAVLKTFATLTHVQRRS
jgi:hypothetical protein